MYHVDAGLDGLGRDDEVAIGAVLKKECMGQNFYLKAKLFTLALGPSLNGRDKHS